MRPNDLIPTRYNKCDNETRRNLDLFFDHPHYEDYRESHFIDLESVCNYRVRQNQIPKWLVALAMSMKKITDIME